MSDAAQKVIQIAVMGKDIIALREDGSIWRKDEAIHGAHEFL